MAQFRATIRGNRGQASRLGTKTSGIEAFVNGWDTGVAVVLDHSKGKDRVKVYRTGGSNHSHSSELLAEWEDQTDAE